MPPRNAKYDLDHQPLQELLAILLRQFKRALVTQGVELTEEDIAAQSAKIARREEPDDRALAVRAALVDLVTESEAALAKWNLSFNQSLTATMDAIPGWESTADFLDIAAEKSSAELRIAAGGALVAALGDLRYAPYLLHLACGDFDVDTVIARRILAFMSDTDRDAPNWLEQVQDWLAKRTA